MKRIRSNKLERKFQENVSRESYNTTKTENNPLDYFEEFNKDNVPITSNLDFDDFEETGNLCFDYIYLCLKKAKNRLKNIKIKNI